MSALEEKACHFISLFIELKTHLIYLKEWKYFGKLKSRYRTPLTRAKTNHGEQLKYTYKTPL
jgi:hypothetical protein